jgi:hypothetical protein
MEDMVTIRASALSDFLDCPARAEAKHLLGLRMPMSGPAVLGTAVHKSTALYDQSTIDGAGITVDEAAGAAVDAIKDPHDDVQWADDSPAEAEKIAIALHTLYCDQIAPTQEYAAVEVRCEKLEITDIGLTLTGTTDRVRRAANDGYGISDLKSGKRAVAADGTVETKGAAYQLGVYELLAERASGIPITEPAEVVGLQAAKTPRGQRVGKSAPVGGARDVLVGEPDSPGVLEMVAKMIHAGAFPGNPRSMLCHERYCPIYSRCRYRM